MLSPAPWGAMPILAFVFAATWFVTGGMAAHLPRLLEIAGATGMKEGTVKTHLCRALQSVRTKLEVTK